MKDCKTKTVPDVPADYKQKYESLLRTIDETYRTFESDYNGQNLSYEAANNTNFKGEPTPDAAVRYFYHKDHLGGSLLVTSSTGAVIQQVSYLPFGEVFLEKRNGDWSSPYLFNGKELDEETGLYYYGARYYDPRASVWLSTDPLQEKYPNVSSYCYTFNNPVNLIDPDGMDIWEINSSGEIVSRTKDKTQDAFFMVAKDADGNYQRTFTIDAEGKKTYNSVSFKYGTIETQETKK